MSYGSVWIDLQGETLLPEEISLLQHRNTGGVLLFTRNYKDIPQLEALIHAIRTNAKKPILIAVDHEGGRKWRFEHGFWKPAAPGEYGLLYKQDPQLALRQLKVAGQIVAHELLNVGVDITFAPLFDLDIGISEVIGDRAYSSDPNIATECAKAFIAGLNQQGMGALGKHFPGHGGCVADSHFAAAVDDRSYEQIERADLVPYFALHSHIAGVMPAHVIYSKIDPNPAGLSKFWLQNILRQKIGFTGAIISDCLSMIGSGFANNIADGAQLALNAGCDMVIISQQTRADLSNILDAIEWQTDSAQQLRIQKIAGNFVENTVRLKPEQIAAA